MSIYLDILFLFIFILWQIFPAIFIWVYLISILIFILIVIIPPFTFRKYFAPYKQDILKILNYEEYESLRKNAAFFLYPIASRMYSSTCSFLYMSSILFTIIFVIRALWMHAIICALNIIIFAPLASIINKPFFVFDTLQSQGLLYWSEEHKAMRVKEIALWRDLKKGNISRNNFEINMNLSKQAKVIEKITEFMKKEWPQIIKRNK